MDAWDFYQRGLWNLWGFTTPSMAQAETMFRRAIEIDPGFSSAHGAVSDVHLQRTFLGEPEERPALLESAMRYARLAVMLDDRDCMNLCVLGRAHCMLQEYEDSVAALEQCFALNPSFAQGWLESTAVALEQRRYQHRRMVRRLATLLPIAARIAERSNASRTVSRTECAMCPGGTKSCSDGGNTRP